MYETSYQAGATSKIVKIRAITISTGLPCTTLTNASSGLAVHYCRDGATQQTITQVSATSGTYTSSGFVHQGDGVYEIGAPTASLAAGSDGVVFSASGVTDVFFTTTRVDLTGTDPRSSAVPDVNVTTIAGQTASAAAGVTFPSSIASPTNITAGTITTVTNLTNAPTAGDLTATMKASVTTAASAATPSVTVSDKTGFSLSTAGILAIWHQLTSAVVTASTMGKLLIDNIDAAISSRLATSGYTAPLDAAGTRSAIGLASANLDSQLDALPTAAENAAATATQITTDHGAGSYIRNTEPLDAAGTRSAVGLASANLDTQLGAIPTAAENAAEVIAAAAADPIASNVKEVNDVTITGTGVAGDKWRPV